jgi:hypothetical protein
MRHFLTTAIVLLFFLTFPKSVQAQSEITIEQMQVKIWPEYDQPTVLVIHNIFLSGDVKFPARMSFNIPVAAGTPHSVAVRELDGQLYLLDYEMVTVGEWNQLTFTTPYSELWIEYYDPSLNKTENFRTFEYQWMGSYYVKSLSLEVQQPISATNMTFKESMGAARRGTDGLTYFSTDVGELKANTKVSLNLQYSKNDDTLSSSVAIPVQPVTPLNDETSQGKTSFTQILPFIFAGIGLVLLVFGLFWFMSRQKENIPASRNRHTPSKKVSRHEGDSIFCHRCGRGADTGDVFCRACGTKLKIEE